MIQKLIKSFGYAFEGLCYSLKSQQNMRIHFVAAIFILFLCCFMPISNIEFLLLLIVIALVLVAELFNTAVESVVDLVTEEYKTLAKTAKDVSAAAVFLTVMLSLLVGGIILGPLIIKSFNFLFK